MNALGNGSSFVMYVPSETPATPERCETLRGLQMASQYPRTAVVLVPA